MNPVARLVERWRRRGAPGAPAGTPPALGPFPRELLGAPVEEAPYLVVDTELTGLDPRRDSIVAIGAVPMRGTAIEVGGGFARLVSPRSDLSVGSILVHGITHAEASGSPPIEAVLPELLAALAGRVLVGHVVGIDLAFLGKETRRIWGRPIGCPAVDTAATHRHLERCRERPCAYHEGTEGAAGDLFTLARDRGIAVRRAHDPLADAFVTAQLFQRHLRELAAGGVATVADLLKVSKPIS